MSQLNVKVLGNTIAKIVQQQLHKEKNRGVAAAESCT